MVDKETAQAELDDAKRWISDSMTWIYMLTQQVRCCARLPGCAVPAACRVTCRQACAPCVMLTRASSLALHMSCAGLCAASPLYMLQPPGRARH